MIVVGNRHARAHRTFLEKFAAKSFVRKALKRRQNSSGLQKHGISVIDRSEETENFKNPRKLEELVFIYI